jgi:tRNA A37 methylthiotransferase MiaB
MNSLKTEVIDAMVAAGMTSALLAPEHGSEYIRNTVIKKGLKRDTIYKVVEDLKKHRVSLAGNWIMGFPEDTNETLQETMDMIDELQLDRNWVGTLIPFPGTPVFDQCVTSCSLKASTWAICGASRAGPPGRLCHQALQYVTGRPVCLAAQIH